MSCSPTDAFEVNDTLEVRLCSLIFWQMALSHKFFVSFTWVTTSYIWDWHFPVPDLLLRGIAHRGHWWLASARASVVPEMQSSFLASGTPWDTGLTKEGRRQRGKSQDCAGTSTIPCFVNIQRLCCCRCGRAGTRVMGTSVAGEMGSQAPVPLLPHCLCLWICLWLMGWSCGCHLACCSGFSVDWAPLQWSEGCEYRHSLFS